VARSNRDVVQRLYAAWNSADPVEGVVPFLDPSFEWVNPSYAVEPGTRHGFDGWRKANSNIAAAFESYQHEPDEVIEADDKVLCFARFSARGRAGGIPYERVEHHLWTLRYGKVIRLQWFDEESEARDAAGLT
jgi:ketosteroid isomerase-like protein